MMLGDTTNIPFLPHEFKPTPQPPAPPNAAAVAEDAEELGKSLDNTLCIDADLRRAATADLESRSNQPEVYAPLLLVLVRSPDARSLSAAIALKNLVKKYWKNGAPPATDGSADATKVELEITAPTFGGS